MKRLSAGLGALLLACGAAGGDAWAEGELKVGISQYPSTLHPALESMAAMSYIHGATLRPITQYDADWQLACHLCTKLPTFEDGDAEVVEREDGTKGVRVTYTLHPDAAWGDGEPITTDDVLFAVEVGKHPRSGVSNAELYRRIVEVVAHDDKTFTIESEKLTFSYNAINDLRPLPEHVERPIFEEDPATYRNRTAYLTEPTNPGLWAGPYTVGEVAVGEYIRLEKNPKWWGEAPFFDTLTVRAIESTTALENMLLTGGVDMIEGSLGLTLDQGLAFEQRHGDRYDVFFQPGLVYEHLDPMLDNPILADARVRRALLHAVDREALNEQLFGGRQPVAHTSVSPLDTVHTEDVPTYGYDPERAKALLEEAGWTEGPDGVRVNAEGEPLRFSIMTTAGNRTRELVQQYLQAEWRKVGIDARIENEPPRVLFAETIGKRAFDGVVMFAWISSPENVPFSTLHSTSIPTEENAWAGQNYPGYDNPEMDALIDAIEIELDFDKRKELWAELQALYAEDLPHVPLYWRANVHVWPEWLEGVEPTGHLGATTLTVEDWRRVDPS